MDKLSLRSSLSTMFKHIRSILKGVAGMEIIDKYNEHAFTSFKPARFAITYLEKELVVLIKTLGVGGKRIEGVGKV